MASLIIWVYCYLLIIFTISLYGMFMLAPVRPLLFGASMMARYMKAISRVSIAVYIGRKVRAWQDTRLIIPRDIGMTLFTGSITIAILLALQQCQTTLPTLKEKKSI